VYAQPEPEETSHRLPDIRTSHDLPEKRLHLNNGPTPLNNQSGEVKIEENTYPSDRK
jgi:hypothetical protein